MQPRRQRDRRLSQVGAALVGADLGSESELPTFAFGLTLFFPFARAAAKLRAQVAEPPPLRSSLTPEYLAIDGRQAG